MLSQDLRQQALARMDEWLHQHDTPDYRRMAGEVAGQLAVDSALLLNMASSVVGDWRMQQMPHGHPQDHGFTARYVWRAEGRHYQMQTPIWQHCGVDAKVKDDDVYDYGAPIPRVHRETILKCPICGLAIRC